ncbi:MAG: hypothetical protein NC203_07360 [Firmicutes bacterium]|nr:hypothetical protein [[Eubacterium] siraeum]MCM1488166.1 hypothetical protein [Bacillota bacterium]
MHSKLTTWLLILLAVVFLARPQGAKAENNAEIASVESVDEDTSDEAIFIFIVIVVILIGAATDACGQEETGEN